MDCYFCGIYKKSVKKGISSFSIPELGILFRTTVDDKDEILIDFSSLLLLSEFAMLNPLLFKNVSFLDLKGSKRVLEYINSEKSIPKKVKPFMDTFVSFCEELSKAGMKIYFTKVPKNRNLALSSINTLKVDKRLMLLLENMRLEVSNDRSKSRG